VAAVVLVVRQVQAQVVAVVLVDLDQLSQQLAVAVHWKQL
jgi:hypothetical protein